jgi:hypothetical protein
MNEVRKSNSSECYTRSSESKCTRVCENLANCVLPSYTLGIVFEMSYLHGTESFKTNSRSDVHEMPRHSSILRFATVPSLPLVSTWNQMHALYVLISRFL